MKLRDGGCFIFLILLLAAYSQAKMEKDKDDAHCSAHPYEKKCKNR